MRLARLVLALMMALPVPALAEGPGLCFTLSDANKILRAIEKDLPDCHRELAANRTALDNGATEALRGCRERAEIYRIRVAELMRERDTCVSLLDNTSKAGEKAVEAARGTWWERLRSVGKWIAVGAVGGVAAYLAVTRGQ